MKTYLVSYRNGQLVAIDTDQQTRDRLTRLFLSAAALSVGFIYILETLITH